MDKNEILLGLHHYHPDGDYKITFIGAAAPVDYADYVASVPEGGTVYTESELTAGADAQRAERQTVTDREHKREQIRTNWAALAAQYPFIGGPFHDKFRAASELLDAGLDDQAIALIQYAEAPASFTPEQNQVFAGVQSQMTAALEAL